MALRARKVSGASEKRPPGMRDYISGHLGRCDIFGVGFEIDGNCFSRFFAEK